jgi:hypothetical protein
MAAPHLIAAKTHSRTYDMGNLFPACFAQVCTKLKPLLTRHQNLVVAQQKTLRRTDRRQSAAFSAGVPVSRIRRN